MHFGCCVLDFLCWLNCAGLELNRRIACGFGLILEIRFFFLISFLKVLSFLKDFLMIISGEISFLFYAYSSGFEQKKSKRPLWIPINSHWLGFITSVVWRQVVENPTAFMRSM